MLGEANFVVEALLILDMFRVQGNINLFYLFGFSNICPIICNINFVLYFLLSYKKKFKQAYSVSSLSKRHMEVRKAKQSRKKKREWWIWIFHLRTRSTTKCTSTQPKWDHIIWFEYINYFLKFKKWTGHWLLYHSKLLVNGGCL